MQEDGLLFKAFNVSESLADGAEVTLLHGDVLGWLDKLADASVDMVFTSPPYNLGKEYETVREMEEYRAWQREVGMQLSRVLAEDGSLCLQVGNYVVNGRLLPLDVLFYELFTDLGFVLRNRVVWHFRHGLHARKRFSGRYELVLWFTKGDRYTFNLDSVRVPQKYPNKRQYKGPRAGELSCHPLGKNPSDVWELIQSEWACGLMDIPNVKHNHPEKTAHPCQFPIELMERFVLALTDPGDLVLDPYAGVGSAVIAALLHGRRAIGIEKERKYVDIALRRLLDLQAGRLKRRPIGRPIPSPGVVGRRGESKSLFDE